MTERGRRLAGGDGADLGLTDEDLGAVAGGAALLGVERRDGLLWAFGGTGAQGLGGNEVAFLLSEGAGHACLDRRDVAGELVAVERHASLQAQRVAGGEAAGLDAVFLAGLEQLVPQRRGVRVVDDELEAVLAGVAGAADKGVNARDLTGHRRVIRQLVDGLLLVVLDERDEDLRGLGALDGDHGNVAGLGLEVHVKAVRALVESLPDDVDVRRVGDDEELRLAQAVGDEVVEDAAVFGDDHRVLRLAHRERGEVRDKRVGEELRGAVAVDPDFAHVGEVKEAGGFADGAVLLELAAVLERHVPRAKRGKGRAELLVLGVERGVQQFRHGFLSYFSSVFVSAPADTSKASGGGQAHTRLRSP